MKVFLESIGCRLNQSEIERFAARFRAEGHELVADPRIADLVVVNTCAVTAAASADSRSKIRQAARTGTAKIVATGCYTTIDPQTVANLPAVDLLIPNNKKEQLVSLALDSNNRNDPFQVSSRMPLPGHHKRTRAFIKVQDGCDNFCTFCITRIARGAHRSQPEAEIFCDIESALKGGVKEIVLSGVNLGAWGRELRPRQSLARLITRIIERYAPQRVRLSSLEPWDITDKLLDVLDLPGFCQHLHLPLQSGSDAVLKRMGRCFSTDDFRSVIDRIRQKNPEIAITSDLMVGFPGENDEEFLLGQEFVRSIDFAGGHVFSFSSRQGTAAEKMVGQVPAMIKKIRSVEIRKVLAESAEKYREHFIGRELNVLWERSIEIDGIWNASGLTDNYLRVATRSKQNFYNQVTKVKISGRNGLVLLAEDLQ
jgi:threonylcarbamoyladenosine tRNA methylthiotransferase MtaB